MKDSKIRILYDDQGFRETHGGVSRYFTEVMRRLPEGYEWVLPIESTNNAYLREPPFGLPPHRQSLSDFSRDWFGGRQFAGISHLYRLCARFFPKTFPSGEWQNRKLIRMAMSKGDYDVFHLTGPHLVNDDWKRVLHRKPIVVTVHDLIPELMYNDRRTARCRARLLAAATHIIAVSDNTKRDILRLYKVPEEKITVIYHGYLTAVPPRSCGEHAFAPFASRGYLLYVGKRRLYKNFRWFVQSVAPLVRTGVGIICTGSPFNPGEKSLLAGLGIADRVIQRYFTDAELACVFSNALAFVYPSWYEGFGIPILDAFARDCPVVLARASCFPEVAGDAALYFDLDNPEELRAQVECLLSDRSEGLLRKRLIDMGRSRLHDFSWEKCAEETIGVYRRVCEA